MKTKAKGKLMTQRDIAEEFGASRRMVLLWAKKGRVGFPAPVRVVERTYFFSRDAVATFFRQQASQGETDRSVDETPTVEGGHIASSS